MTDETHWSNEPGRWNAELRPEAWATIPRIQAPTLSPDASKIAYVRGFDGRNDVWVVDLDGGHPIQITDAVTPQGPDPSQRQAMPLCWTPDSRHVIFASNNGGKLYKVPAGGGPSVQIEEAVGNHHSPAVSPDGARIAFVAERGEDVDIFVVSADGTLIRQMSSQTDDGFVANPEWSPGGGQLMWTSWPHYDMPWDETSIIVSESTQSSAAEVAGGERVSNNWSQWSPDGKWIAFTSDRDGDHHNLWRMKPDGSDTEALVSEHCDHHRPVWSPDGKKIAYLRIEDCEHQIWVWDDGDPRQITTEPGVHSDLAWIDNDEILCVFESPLFPADLWVVNLDKDRRRLTQSATGGVIGGNLTLPKVMSWESSDGLEISGMLFEPDDIRPGKHPLMVHIHGGPVGQATKNWQPWIQQLVQQGYVVLVPNYRGSKGYGRAFMEKLYGDWGGGDLDDYITGAKAVIARGAVDPGRVVATGGSAGGYSTLICMTKAPDVFKAGIARYGISNLKSFHRKTWVFERYYLAKLMGGTGGERSDLYDDRSPINFVDDVTGPLLILQGDIDIVCHRSEMDNMTEALKAAGKDVEYHVYDGEGHGWKKISTIIDDANRSEKFLLRAVMDG
ncbi:prolyl oligopeptidase family serine peptidase [soil metagenome]